MEDKTVYILDSYGLIFRCYFAFISRPLTNQKGENVSALFGFFRNLHFIFKHYSCIWNIICHNSICRNIQFVSNVKCSYKMIFL